MRSAASQTPPLVDAADASGQKQCLIFISSFIPREATTTTTRLETKPSSHSSNRASILLLAAATNILLSSVQNYFSRITNDAY